jgi:hypothetical protein
MHAALETWKSLSVLLLASTSANKHTHTCMFTATGTYTVCPLNEMPTNEA